MAEHFEMVFRGCWVRVDVRALVVGALVAWGTAVPVADRRAEAQATAGAAGTGMAGTGMAGTGVAGTGAETQFAGVADRALQAMAGRAGEMKVSGVAVLAYADGETVRSWSSKMLVVGRLREEPSATGKGSNLLAIAYAKASEMADTLRNSGSGVRPPMTGEFGWEGGVIARVKGGYVIAAFSGGRSEDDVAISRVGAAAVVAVMGGEGKAADGGR